MKKLTLDGWKIPVLCGVLWACSFVGCGESAKSSPEIQAPQPVVQRQPLEPAPPAKNFEQERDPVEHLIEFRDDSEKDRERFDEIPLEPSYRDDGIEEERFGSDESNPEVEPKRSRDVVLALPHDPPASVKESSQAQEEFDNSPEYSNDESEQAADDAADPGSALDPELEGFANPDNFDSETVGEFQE